MKVKELLDEIERLCKYTECDVLEAELQFDWSEDHYKINQMRYDVRSKKFLISGDKIKQCLTPEEAAEIDITKLPIIERREYRS